MAVIVNVIGLIIFLAIAVLFSQNRRAINKVTVAKLFALNIFVGWFLTSFTIGREIIIVIADVFVAVIAIAHEGVAFALPN